MRPSVTTISTQPEIPRNMQPQNMILPANKPKTKKYAVSPVQLPQSSKQSLTHHTTTQPQFQINKAYNVVSILKTSSPNNAQQSSHMVSTQGHQGQPPHQHMQQQQQQVQSQQQTQSYANVVNRQSMTTSAISSGSQQQSTVICSAGNIMTVNDINSAAIYNLTSGHRAPGGGGSSGIIDSNGRFVGSVSTVSDLSKGSVSNNTTQLATVSGSSNSNGGSVNGGNQIIALTNSHGITVGPSNSPYTIHDKGLLGVGVNVSCIDNRKFDYKNNNLLSNSNFQAAQEFLSSGNNNSGNTRSNPQSSGIYRGPPPASNASRGSGGGGGGVRHVHMPTMYPNVVMQQYPQFSQRQPTFQTSHIQYAPGHISYFPYPYLSTLPQQPPPHSRNGVSVNTNVNLNNAMQPVQPGGPNGPLAGPVASSSQLQLLTGAVQPGANTVLGVGSAGNGQVGVPPMVSVITPNVAPQSVQAPPTSRRRHQHRLQIIDPATRKNILDDLDKSNSSADNEFHDQGPISAVTTSAAVPPDMPPICISQLDTVGIGMEMANPSGIVGQGSPDPRTKVRYKIEINLGPTPVVSAMSDAPSVEILPTPQKSKSKKIPIVSPRDDSDLSTVLTPIKVDDEAIAAIKTTIENSQQNNPQTDSISALQTKQESELHTQEKNPQKDLQEQQQSHSQFMEHAATAPEKIEIVDQATRELYTTKTIEARNVDTPVIQSSVEIAEIQTPLSSTECALADSSSKQIDEENVSSTKAVGTLEEETPHEPSNISPTPPLPQSSHESTPDETDRSPMPQFVESKACIMTKAKTKDIFESVVSPQIPEVNTVDTELPELTSEPEAQQETLSTEEDRVANEEPSANASKVGLETSASTPSLINYNEGQWSPSNPDGKKQYDREQLMQLREAKASRVQPEVKNVSILPHPNLMPMFMRNNNNNKRVQSMVGVIGGGGGRNNDSGGNFVGKQVSMSGVQGGRSSMKGMIHVNLSLNQDVKLNETENAWRPRAAGKSAVGESSNDSTSDSGGGKTTQEKDELVRRVRGILNKLTPERFDTLVEEIVKLKIDTPDKMDEVIVLVFEKAIDEPNFSVSYARLCHRLISEVKARDERMESGTKLNLQHFRNALLDKTEREFTQNVSQSTAKEKKLQPIVDKIRKCNDPNEKAEMEALLEEEERKIRRRSGGTVRFIGELFKISMLTGKIVYSCIDTLLNPQSEDMLECLCKLLTTVGAKFEQTPVNAKDPGRCYSLEKLIGRMQGIANRTDKDALKVSSRVRFMLQDVIDLRKNKWQSTRNEAPKTMGQIEKEAKNEQLSAQYMNYSGSLSTSSANGPQTGSSGKRDDRSRFDARSTGYGGSHSQRGDAGTGSGNLRHQQGNSGRGSGGIVNSSGVGTNSVHSNGNNDDNTWHVQTSKGSRSQAVDTYKLEGLTLQLSQNLDTKKMGGVSQFIWNNDSRQSSTPTTTPSNSFAALSSLIDKNMSDRDRNDRDRSGPRNKGSYNKGSMERDRYGDRGIHSRTGSSQGSRENSSSRVGQHQQSRGMINSSLQKSASHSKYTQQAPTARLSNKAIGSSLSSNSGGNVNVMYRGNDHQPPTSSSASTSISASQIQSQSAKNVSPPAVFIEPCSNDLKLFKSVVSEIIELAATSKTFTPAVVDCIKRIPEQQRCGLLFYILTDYLHLADVGKQYRRYLANTIAYLIQQNYLSVDHFKLAYKEFSEFANDLIVDIPNLWLYVLQFSGPLIVKKMLTVSDLWTEDLRANPSSKGKNFLKTYLTYCTREVGPNFTRSMWKKFNMHWSDFMPESEVNDFIESNRLEYVENESMKPVIERGSSEKYVKDVIDHIEHLLKEGSTADCIIDYCNGNIVVADKAFVRGLTKNLCNFAIVYKDFSYKLEPEVFQKVCIPVFLRYIDSNDDLQLECLYGVQLLVHSLEHPRGLLGELFGELYDGYVIQKESLCKWRDSKDQSAGKGVAVKSLNPFFNSIFNEEAN